MGKISEDSRGILEYKKKCKVVKIGSGAHVLVPVALLGKTILIHYKRKEEKKK